MGRSWWMCAAVVLAACGGSNTRCEIGDRMCGDEGTVLECQDETGMGDADGEFIELRDCVAEGLECALEAIDLEHAFVGCVDPACSGACPVLGARVCSRDGMNVSACAVQADGCQRRVIEQACGDTGQVCEYATPDQPECVAP